ncbi:MAG: carboxypeptidase regulatory-like domain-containing protein [Nitrososphaerota archaeon]|nr:carboxypeptidase regulatory-like domain-containing protein [Nitrososphaerota archaeon]
MHEFSRYSRVGNNETIFFIAQLVLIFSLRFGILESWIFCFVSWNRHVTLRPVCHCRNKSGKPHAQVIFVQAAPISSALVVADNGLGGSLSSTPNSQGLALLALPTGTYNVTVTSGGQSLTQTVTVTTNGKTSLHFNFTSVPSAPENLEYVLISLVVIGLLADVVLWLRPRR